MDEVVMARRKLQELVDSDIEKNGPLSGNTLLWNMKIISRAGNDKYGAEYMGNLLPVNCRKFATIVNLLERAQIHTKSQLIGLSDFDIRELKNVGPEKASYILAMRELAIAEMKQASQKQ